MTGSGLKLKLRNLGRRLGLEVRASGVNTRLDLRIKHLIERYRPDILFDVGANRGQFAASMFEIGFPGRIVSFEALPGVYEELSDRARPFGDRWLVAPRCALGGVDGRAVFHVTANLQSSSILPLSEYSKARSLSLSETNAIEVPVRRLDELVAEIGIKSHRPFLKLDVQGAEQQVLAGAQDLQRQAVIVLCEMHFAHFYEGQADWRTLDGELTKAGFTLWDIKDLMRMGGSGRLEAADFLYVQVGRDEFSQSIGT